MRRFATLCMLLLCSSAAAAAEPGAGSSGPSEMAIAGITVSVIGAGGVIAGISMAIAGGVQLSDTAADYGCEGGECPDEAEDDEAGAVMLRDAGFVIAGLSLIPFAIGVGLWVYDSGRQDGAQGAAELRVGPGSVRLVVAF